MATTKRGSFIRSALEELRMLVEAERSVHDPSHLNEAAEMFVKLAEESSIHVWLRSCLDSYARANGYAKPVAWKGRLHPYIGPDVRRWGPNKSLFVGEAKRSDTETPQSAKEQIVEHLAWIRRGLERRTVNYAVYAIAINERAKLERWRNAVARYIRASGLDVTSCIEPKIGQGVHAVIFEVALPED